MRNRIAKSISIAALLIAVLFGGLPHNALFGLVLPPVLSRQLYLWTDLTCLAVFAESLVILMNKHTPPIAAIRISESSPESR